MAEYKIVTWRQALLDWRIVVYLGTERVYTGRDYATRSGAIRAVKRKIRHVLESPKNDPYRAKEEWFDV